MRIFDIPPLPSPAGRIRQFCPSIYTCQCETQDHESRYPAHLVKHGVCQRRGRRLQILLIRCNTYPPSPARTSLIVSLVRHSGMPSNLLLEGDFQHAHFLLDLGQLELRGGIERRRQKDAVATRALAIDTWMRFVAFELAAPAFQAGCDHAVAAADLGRGGRRAGGVGHDFVCDACCLQADACTVYRFDGESQSGAVVHGGPLSGS